MSNDSEAGQARCESATDPIRNRKIEGCQPPFAKPHQEDSCKQDCHNRSEYSDSHDQFPFSSPNSSSAMHKRNYCSFAYSALACFRMAMSGSASFHWFRKSWYAAFAFVVSPDSA